MNCKEFSDLLDAYLAGTLPDGEAAAMKAHAQACPDCGLLAQACLDARRADEETEVPASFSASWRQRIREENNMEKKHNWKGWLAAAAALVFVVGGTLITRDGNRPAAGKRSAVYENSTSGTAVSASYRAPSYTDYEDGAYAMEEAAYAVSDAAPAAKTADNGAARQEKIIRSASFTLRTLRYDEDLQTLQDLTAQAGGRVEYMTSSGDASAGQLRSASLTLRIPAERLDDFLAGAQGIGNVTALTREMEDVSDSYYDTQTRLETQQKKLQRLQALLASATKVSDLIEIESAIADAQYYIDRYTSQLKGYDSKAEYSTVRVSLKEIREEEAEDTSWGHRLVLRLQESLEGGWAFLQDLVIFLVSVLPWMAAAALAIVIVIRIIRKKKEKNGKKE